MRSVNVVLPESICAEIPIFLRSPRLHIKPLLVSKINADYPALYESRHVVFGIIRPSGPDDRPPRGVAGNQEDSRVSVNTFKTPNFMTTPLAWPPYMDWIEPSMAA